MIPFHAHHIFKSIYIRSRLDIYMYMCIFLGGGTTHLLSLPFHLPVVLLQLVVERLTTRHQILSPNLTCSLLPDGLVGFSVVLLLLLAVGRRVDGEVVRTKSKRG